MKNDLLRREYLLKKEFCRRGQAVERQFCQDTTVIVLNRVFGFSKTRIEKFFDACNEARDRYCACFDPTDEDAAYLREDFDRVLSQIMGEETVASEPFGNRYPDIKYIDPAGNWHERKDRK